MGGPSENAMVVIGVFAIIGMGFVAWEFFAALLWLASKL